MVRFRTGVLPRAGARGSRPGVGSRARIRREWWVRCRWLGTAALALSPPRPWFWRRSRHGPSWCPVFFGSGRRSSTRARPGGRVRRAPGSGPLAPALPPAPAAKDLLGASSHGSRAFLRKGSRVQTAAHDDQERIMTKAFRRHPRGVYQEQAASLCVREGDRLKLIPSKWICLPKPPLGRGESHCTRPIGSRAVAREKRAYPAHLRERRGSGDPANRAGPVPAGPRGIVSDGAP